MEKNLGHATAYGYAKSKGYTGTEEEFGVLMASYASVAQDASQSASSAAESAQLASNEAQRASQSATSAHNDAETASNIKTDVESARDTTVDAKNATVEAKNISVEAKNSAISAKDTAESKAQIAEAWAVGQKDGTDVSSADETYHNNAKYYSEQANIAKTDAESARDAAAQSASEAAESARTLTIDATLMQNGQAADARATGDAITESKNDLNDISNVVNSLKILSTHSKVLDVTAGVTVPTTVHIFDVSITAGQYFTFEAKTNDITSYAIYADGHGLIYALSPNEKYSFYASSDISYLSIYTNTVTSSGTIDFKLLVLEYVEKTGVDYLTKQIGNMQNKHVAIPHILLSGYLNANGTLGITDYKELHTNLLPVTAGDSINIELLYKDATKTINLQYERYDSLGNALGRYSINTTNAGGYTGTLVVPSDTSFISIMFRTYGDATFNLYKPWNVFSDLEEDFDSLDYHIRYETEEIIATKNVTTTSGTKIDSTDSEITVSIASGASFRFRVSGTSLINKYALYYKDGGESKRFAFNLLPNTNYDYTAPEAVTSLYIYTGGTDVIGSGTLILTVLNVVQNNNSVDKKIADLEHTSDEMSVLRGDKWTLNKNDFTELCVHHDNFSRIMTGYEIGMNAGGSDTGNNYDWVTPSSYDDGLAVNNGATFSAGTRTYNYSLRKIVSENADNFMIETNAPKENAPVMFGFNVTDINNFTELEIRKISSGYRIFVNVIRGGTTYQNVVTAQVNQIIAQVAQLYVVRGILYLVLDDRMCVSAYVGSLGNHVFLASYRSFNTHFDFVNVFSLIGKVTWNPNPTLDTGETNIPLKTVSANDGNYELQNTETRWSAYADHFTLHSTDELIHNGRRSEISISHINLFKYNLRTIKVSFDVLFPSEYVDTEQEDLFVQFHDRDGTYRGTVPFALYIKNNTINVNTSSTVKPKDDNTSVIIDLHRFDFCDVELGKWHHFEIECKERYEARQNPFLRITIDGITQFEYRKANCYNDLLGASPQYGIYKNNWGTGVTEFQRYFDNFKIEYI